ncbi:MAG: hypothetical protein K1060chlam1_00230 [Candidatus Anoxychlamydiales bacterium]|nr:hypothetical protein [Candidatus Anoxychlamydiales bacterium]
MIIFATICCKSKIKLKISMKFFIKILIPFIGIAPILNANDFMNSPLEKTANLNVNNTVLAKVEDRAITALDVKKRLDTSFERSFPDLIGSKSARFQFYQTGWLQVLDELINNELILLDAAKRSFNISDAELTEETENRYGPNVILNLQKQNLTLEEAQKMLSDEMVIHRMMYYFIRAKAEQNITPSQIKHSFRLYLKENPSQEIYSYNVISIRCDDDKASNLAAKEIHLLLQDKNQDPKELEDLLKEKEKGYKNCSINVSNLYKVSSKDLALSHKNILKDLKKNSFSDISSQVSRINNKKVARIFYLKDLEKVEAKSFDEMANDLKTKLMEKELNQIAEKYFIRLKNDYLVEHKISSKDFCPFTFE